MGKKTIKIAFILELNRQWMGGVNYFLNLLWLIKNKIPEFETYVFISPNLSEDLKKQFEIQTDHLICANFLKPKTLSWIVFKIFNKLFLKNFIVERMLSKYNIDIVSHTNSLFKNINSIAWIPDFQHIHLPHMFSKEETKRRDKIFFNLIKKTQGTIVSSMDAYQDCCAFASQFSSKIHVFHFISQTKHKASLDENFLKKNNIEKSFFYVPNQLWKHKNHILLIKAAKILKDKNINFQIVCSGSLEDYRHLDYKDQVFDLVKKYDLDRQVKFLGLIPYKYVVMLMEHSLATINPSLFEGWSSTVEECKSLGKTMILSDINVHIEQYPQALFFSKNDPVSLADAMFKTIRDKSKCFFYDYSQDIEKAREEYRQIVLLSQNQQNNKGVE